MNYFEDHIGDYAAATSHLSWDEDMAYTRLIRAYYHAEKAIPQAQVYRLARAATPAQKRAVDTVIGEFFILEDGSYRQKRCEEEIARYQDKQRKAKASAKARWDKQPTHSEGNADACETDMRTHSEGNAPRAYSTLQTPDTIPKEEQGSLVVADPADKPAAVAAQNPKGSRLPSTWVLPQAWGEWSMAELGWTTATVRFEAEKFADHWHAKAGKDACKADWHATWRNWCRNVRSTLGGASKPQQTAKSFAERDADNQRARIFEMTGGLMGKPKQAEHNTIDMEPTHGHLLD